MRNRGGSRQAGLLTAVGLVVFAAAAAAQEPKPADKPPPAKPVQAQPAPPQTLDQLLDALSKMDPKQLNEHLVKLEAAHKKLNDEAAALRNQLTSKEAQAAAVKRRIDMLKILLRPAGDAGKPAPKTAAAPVKSKPSPEPAPQKMAEAKAAAPAMAAKTPKPAPMTTPPEAKEPSVRLVNYEQHVKPILIENCVTCHNPDKARGGLIVDSFGTLMEGGSSGEVLSAGDPDGSRLWLLLNHEEKPHMPWKQPKLADAQLKVIRTWIEQGVLANADSKPQKVARAGMAPVDAVPSPRVASGGAPLPVTAPKQLAAPTARPTAAVALAASPVAPLLAVCGTRQIVLYHAETRAIVAVLPYPEGTVRRLQFTADGLWLLAAGGTAGKQGIVVIFDVASGQRVAELEKQYDAIPAAAIDPYRELVAAGGSNRVVRVHDLLTGEVAYEIRKHNDWITAVAFSPDATLLATADRSGGLFVWEAETGREVHELRGHSGAIHDLAFRPGSDALASAGEDRSVRLWNMDDGKQIKRFNAHGGATLAVDFAPDARLTTGGSDGVVKLWKPDGSVLRTFEPLGDWVYVARFLERGKLVMAGNWAGQIHIFEAETGRRVWQLDTNPHPAAHVALGD